MTKQPSAVVAVLLWAMVAPLLAHCERRQITREEVLSQLKSGLTRTRFADLDLAPEQVRLPVTIFAEPDAKIRLVKIVADRRAHSIVAQFRCEKTRCRPFFASVVNVDFPPGIMAAGTVRVVDESVQTTAPSVKVVHQGEAASLILQTSGLRMSVPVVCLQAGSAGQVIRTRILGTNRVATARVIGPKRVSAIAAGRKQ